MLRTQNPLEEMVRCSKSSILAKKGLEQHCSEGLRLYNQKIYTDQTIKAAK